LNSLSFTFVFAERGSQGMAQIDGFGTFSFFYDQIPDCCNQSDGSQGNTSPWCDLMSSDSVTIQLTLPRACLELRGNRLPPEHQRVQVCIPSEVLKAFVDLITNYIYTCFELGSRLFRRPSFSALGDYSLPLCLACLADGQRGLAVAPHQ
jgi:hypothetical protein